MADSTTPAAGPDSDAAPAAASGSSQKKTKQNIKYPPYVYGYGAISKLFDEIKKASVPPKFTQDFMETMLGLTSSSHRALIPLLKKLGYIDASNVPTESYKNYRDDDQSGRVMAEQMRTAYADVYRANEYAHTLSKEQLGSKIRLLTGAAEDDANIPAVVGTFLELKKLADFDAAGAPKKIGAEPKRESEEIDEPHGRSRRKDLPPFGLSYTINLNLPATTEIEVFNAIFRSLKEHLLEGR